MSQFIIEGGKILSGNWQVQGMKNAALPVLAACLITDKPCIIHNIPQIRDVHHMIELIRALGVSAEWKGDHTLHIHAQSFLSHELDYKLAKSMRASVLLIGPLIARLGTLTFPEPGGCNIGNRPLDAHFEALQALGATITKPKEQYYTIEANTIHAAHIRLKEQSVTATENALMAACGSTGTTVIENAATEPHVAQLARVLRSMGATVSGEGTTTISITGASEYGPVEAHIIPDQLEIGTIAVLAAICASEISIGPVVHDDMRIILEKLQDAGVPIEVSGDRWIIKNAQKTMRSFSIETAPYPGFPTDLQAPFGLLATQATGKSSIHDSLFENRLGYLEQLTTMGATATIADAHHATIVGPTPLHGKQITSLDLRAGVTLVLAGLIAHGTTVIDEAEIIDRGYESFDARLQAIGASIKRVV